MSPKTERVRGWMFTDWGNEYPVDVPLEHAHEPNFDALHLPGGVMNPDTRMDPQAVAFVKAFFDAGKPVSVICHGPWTVIEAGAARGRRGRRSRRTSATRGPSGSTRRSWSTRGSSSRRKPDDIPAFNNAMIELFAQRVPAHH